MDKTCLRHHRRGGRINAALAAAAWHAIRASSSLVILIIYWTSVGAAPIDHSEMLDLGREHVLALELGVDRLDVGAAATVRISVLSSACPMTYEFLAWLADNQEEACSSCTIYRGEPVPEDGGGGAGHPPFALVQGGFVNTMIPHLEREMHRPKIERGMVAWAGHEGVHFLIALADHPEWGNKHTVWGRVLEEDMPVLDRLVQERPLVVVSDGGDGSVPITNFAEPIPFRLAEY